MKTFILITTALTLVASLALAQQGQPGENFLDQWDMDGDGSVTLDEALEKRAEVFDMFDQDDDGALDATDWQLITEHLALEGGGEGISQAMGKGPGKLMHAAMELSYNDANGDGVVTKEEFTTATKTLFPQLDRNGDGVLTTADFGRW